MAERAVVCPTACLDAAAFGHAHLARWRRAVEKRGQRLQERRELQAIILAGDLADEDLQDLVKALPQTVQLLLFGEDQLAVVSREGIRPTSEDDEEARQILKSAHLRVYRGHEAPTADALLMDPAELDKILSDYISARADVLARLSDFEARSIPSKLGVPPDLHWRAFVVAADIKATWVGAQAALLRFADRSKDSSSFGRAERLFAVNDVIWRIRALWDKLMLLAAMVEDPEILPNLLQAKSIRRSFIRNLERPSHPFALHVWDAVHALEAYEAHFRTPELHKVGRTCYWAAQPRVGHEMNRLLAYYNDLNQLIQDHFRQGA
jgi:hypothetical protein